jgi:hypothetical protein
MTRVRTSLLAGLLPVFICAQPLQNRILIATSRDGLNWQRLNTILVDSGDVPDAVLLPSGQVSLYFQGLWTHIRDGIMVATSPDGISDWQFFPVPIPGTESWPGRPCDPDLTLRDDTFRLYFTGDPVNDMQPETYSAYSLDGISFVRDSGIRFEVPGAQVLDPSVLWTGDTLQYFAGGAPQGWNWHAHSLDGVNLVQQPNFTADSLMMANGIALPGSGYRFYGFSNRLERGIRSVYSLDGSVWSVDSGCRLQVDSSSGLESRYVKDPAIVFRDSIYIMYYVTRKPTTAMKAERQAPAGSAILELSPNPCLGIMSVRLAKGVSKLALTDASGRRLRQLSTPQAAGRLVRLDLRDLPDGVYFLSAPGSTAPARRFVRLRQKGE